jgi:hypothetical protein
VPRSRSIPLLSAGLLALGIAVGCAGGRPRPPETFAWVTQPIQFSPPPARWYREAERSGGLLGVRFVLSGGVGECITVAAYREFAERDRRAALDTLIARVDSLTQREFFHELSLVRARTDNPLSEAEASASLAINAALDRAASDYAAGHRSFVLDDLREALRAAEGCVPTLPDILPRIRLRPERMQEPDRWRIGYERDTTIAGLAAFAVDDTLITPERRLLYREIYLVAKGCAFKLSFQGRPENLRHFDRLVASVYFPEGANVTPR